MKKILSLILLSSVCVLGAAEEKPLNILFFGNSYTYSAGVIKKGGLPMIMKEIMKADKKHPLPNTQMTVAGGKSLRYHADTEKSVASIAAPKDFTPAGNFKWDVAVFQNSSQAALDGHIAKSNDEFLTGLVDLETKVREHSPDFKGVVYQTWAREAGSDLYKNGKNNPTLYAEQLHRNYHRVCKFMNDKYKKDLFVIAPAGDAWQKLNFDKSLYVDDLHHASAKGMTLNALIMYRTIYGEKVSGIDLSAVAKMAGITDEEMKSLQAVADSLEIKPVKK